MNEYRIVTVGGYVTCASLSCKDPCAAGELLLGSSDG